QIERADASSITAFIKDCLTRMNLSIHKARGQCYEGCSTMSGAKTGVAAQMKKSETRCLYCHCYGYSLNLACTHCIRRVKNNQKEALDTTYEKELVKNPLKRDAKLQQIKEHSDTEMKARIRGVDYHMMKFYFFHGLALGEFLLRHTDSLSTTLQRPNLSAAEGQSITSMTVNNFSNLRSEFFFFLFLADVMSKAEERDIEEAALPRCRAVPGKLDCGTAAPEYFQTPTQIYRAMYYEAVDLIVSLIKDRFDQRDYNVY
ncbi:hypothetical protein LSAT2_014476, partial [Lamellibrachia satsuma]